MQSKDKRTGSRHPISSTSLPSENPALPGAAGFLALARSLPVVLSFVLSLSALWWLYSGLPSRDSHTAGLAQPEESLTVPETEMSDSRQSLLDRLPSDTLVPVFSPSVMYWAPQIILWARSHDLNPNLVATVMQIESCGHPSVRSPSGAIGLFQVMPYHFIRGESPQNPDTNALRGLAYLAKSLSLADGWVPGTLAGYNGGHGLIPKERSQWPRQTRRYVRWGMGILKDIVSSGESSQTLQEWLDRGGDRLCSEAQRALADDHYSAGISRP